MSWAAISPTVLPLAGVIVGASLNESGEAALVTARVGACF
jgi:hypothetical protein